MKAVIYARYSSDSQREESIEGQLRECKEYAERNGITVLSTYIDRALSAKTDNRPDFQRMIKDSANGLFDIVLVWKLDRFARNRYDSAHYKAILKKNGVKVVSAKEAIAEDSTGILLESLLEGYAEFYSVELSEKIHRGQKENALKGLNNGGGIPLGYVLGSDKRLAVDPMTAPVVLEIFTRYADGETVRAIVESLNERGLQTKHNKPYSLGSFNAILKNRKYIGEYRYQDVVIPGGVPAIVPQELFDRVQARIARNKRAPAMSKADEAFLLTTKLFCGKCGRLMVVLLFFKDPETSDKSERFNFKQVLTVMKLPQVWILCLILCCTYVMNMSYAYFNPYATSTLGVAMVGGTIVTIMADYIRPFASVGGGVLADRLGRPRIMTIAFAIMAVGTFAIALFPKMSVPVFVALCALVYVGMYCNYGIVFSLMDDGGIPMEVSGTAVGVICTIGYLPEVVCPATAGIILDTFTEAGYKYYFLAVGIIMLIGIVGIMIWNRSMKKQKALNK